MRDSVLFFCLSGLFLAKASKKELYQHQRYLKKDTSACKLQTVAHYKRFDVKILEILKGNAAIELSIKIRKMISLKIHTLVRQNAPQNQSEKPEVEIEEWNRTKKKRTHFKNIAQEQ